MNSILELFPESHLDETSSDINSSPLVTKNYIICFTARSGSTWLSSMIASTNQLGEPEEWFNPGHIKLRNKRMPCRTILEYANMTRTQECSANGVFGIELSYPHFTEVSEALTLQQLFGEMPVWFYLSRQNLIRQGISLYLSAASGYFHSFDRREDVREKYLAVEYDADRIASKCKEILEHEMGFEKIFRQNNIEPVRFTYEDLTRDPDRILRLFFNVMQVEYVSPQIDDPNDQKKVKKISNKRNQEWESRFRRERPDFVRTLGQERQTNTPFINYQV